MSRALLVLATSSRETIEARKDIEEAHTLLELTLKLLGHPPMRV
jgi:hypothetical protein